MKQSLTSVALIALSHAAAITKEFLEPVAIKSIDGLVNYGTLTGRTRWEREGYGAEANLYMITILEVDGTDADSSDLYANYRFEIVMNGEYEATNSEVFRLASSNDTLDVLTVGEVDKVVKDITYTVN